MSYNDESLTEFIPEVEKQLMQFCLFFESRLPDGSSAKMTAGLFIKALATATRCFSPPENSAGLWLALSLSPMKSSSSLLSFCFFVALSSYIGRNHDVFYEP
jgi:hypothetical protein